MTLGDLLCDIKVKYDKAVAELKPYRSITEVESFLRRRGEDLKEFERIVDGYSLSTPIGVIINSLREEGVPYKIYGICTKGREYFVVTKKVQKAIKEFEDDLLRQAAEQEKQEKLNFDKDYAIPDDLTPEQIEEIFES